MFIGEWGLGIGRWGVVSDSWGVVMVGEWGWLVRVVGGDETIVWRILIKTKG